MEKWCQIRICCVKKILKSLTLISRVTSAEPWNSVFISWALFTVYSISCNRGYTQTFSHELGLLFRDGVPFWHGS